MRTTYPRNRKIATVDEVRAFVRAEQLTKRAYDTARLKRADVVMVMYPAAVHFKRHYGRTFNEMLEQRRPGSGYATREEVQAFAATLKQREYDAQIVQFNRGRSKIFPHSSRFPKVYGATFGNVVPRVRQPPTESELEERRSRAREAKRKARAAKSQSTRRHVHTAEERAALHRARQRARYHGDPRAREAALQYGARRYVEQFEKIQAQYKDFYRRNRDRIYHREILRKYGVSKSDLQALHEAQQGLCAICKQTPAPGARLQIDHCHRLGHVRGLLCSPCNRALGLLEDDLKRCRAMLDYMERPSWRDGAYERTQSSCDRDGRRSQGPQKVAQNSLSTL